MEESIEKACEKVRELNNSLKEIHRDYILKIEKVEIERQKMYDFLKRQWSTSTGKAN